MTRHWQRNSGLLVLVLLLGCDNGSAKQAPKAKAAVTVKQAHGAGSKTPAGKAVTPSPTKAAAEVDAKAGAPPVEPPPTEPAAVADAPPTEPPAVADAPPTEPPAVADTPPAEPAAVADPPPAEPAAVADPPAVESAAGVAATAGSAEVGGIALGEGAELQRLVLAHDVVKRQPVDPATSFPTGQKVSLFIEARNQSGGEKSVKVTWENTKTGRRSGPTTVRIPERKVHRTRAYRTMKKPGDYRCIVLGEGGTELASLSFTVQ